MRKLWSMALVLAMIFSICIATPAGAQETEKFANKICTVELSGGGYLSPSGEERGNGLTSGEKYEWRLKKLFGGYALIGENGFAADVNSASMESGASIIQWTASYAQNQKWNFEDAGSGCYYIISALSGLYVTENDGKVTQEEKADGKNQKWKIDITGEYEPQVERLLNSEAAKALDEYKYDRLYTYLMAGGEFNMLCYNKVEQMIDENDYFNMTKDEQSDFIESLFDVVSVDLMYGSMATKEKPEVRVVKTEKRDHVWLWYSKPDESAWVYTLEIEDAVSGNVHTMEYISVEENDEDYALLVGEAVGCFEEPIRRQLTTFFWTAADEGTWNGGGGQIWNNTDYRGDVDNMVQMFAHELGHVMDDGKIDYSVWTRAAAQDMVPVTGYGNTTRWEDLAEYSRCYLLSRGDESRIEPWEETYPERTIAYKALLYAVDKEFYKEYEDEFLEATAPIGDFRTKNYVRLKADGKYLTDVGGVPELAAEKDAARDWQTWIVYTSGEGTSILQNKATGKYLSFDSEEIGARLTLGDPVGIGIKQEKNGYSLVSEATGFKVNEALVTALDDEAAAFEIEDMGKMPYAGNYSIKLRITGEEMSYDAENGLGVSETGGTWEIVPADIGYYMITDAATGKALDVSGASYQDGAEVIEYEQTRGYNQQFEIKNNGDGTYSFVLRHSGMTLGVRDGKLCQGEGKSFCDRWIIEKK